MRPSTRERPEFCPVGEVEFTEATEVRERALWSGRARAYMV